MDPMCRIQINSIISYSIFLYSHGEADHSGCSIAAGDLNDDEGDGCEDALEVYSMLAMHLNGGKKDGVDYFAVFSEEIFVVWIVIAHFDVVAGVLVKDSG